MRHQLGQCNWLGKSIWNLEVSEVSVDVSVQIQFPLLDKLHYGRPGKNLGKRSGAEDCCISSGKCTALQVGVAVPLCEEDLPVSDYSDRPTRNMVGIHQVCHQRI